MELTKHAKHSLSLSRKMAEQMLSAFQTEDDWHYRPFARANPAIWIVAHLGLADNAFASVFRPAVDSKPAGWDELFWFGSQMTDDRSLYPDAATVLDYYRDRRETFLSVLDELTPSDIEQPAPAADQRSPIAGAPNLGSWLLFALWHEGLHTGQLSICHRGLGHAPLIQPS